MAPGSFRRRLAWPLVLGGFATGCGTSSDLDVTVAGAGGGAGMTQGRGGAVGAPDGGKAHMGGSTNLDVFGGQPSTGGTAAGGLSAVTGGAPSTGGTSSGGVPSGGRATGGIAAGGAAIGGAGAGSCLPRDDDPTGYLVKICEYLLAHRDTIRVLVDPNSYHIDSIERRTEAGRNVLWVRLDCCFTGDIAIIDPATDEVIGFSVGDV